MAISRAKVESSLDQLMRFGEEHPEAMARAQQCISEWGKSGKQLQQCIAEALLEVQANGLQSIAKPQPGLVVHNFQRIQRHRAEPPKPQRLIRGR